jgi:succinoglycan biosynthesis protein ExoO
MSTKPLVSAIIPAFRAEATLPGAARSLLAQTYSRWEAILASDDGVDYLALLGRCASLEAFLDLTANGRASWVQDELARLRGDPARAA